MKEDLGKQHHHRLTCHTINNGNTADMEGSGEEKGGGNGFRIQNSNAPITRGPIFFKNDLESPGASDIVSPASGFSDSESELGSQIPIYCPAHGPIPLVPLRYLNRHHFPLLPAVQEQTYQSDTYDEGGSTYSSGQNSDQMIICTSNNPPMLINPSSGGNNSSSEKLANSAGLVNEWRLRRGVQRSDAIYISDDGKSSLASSPGRICPRCLEKEQRESSGGNHQIVGIVRQPSSDSKSVMAVMDDVSNGGGGTNLKNGHNNSAGVGGSPGMQFDSGIIDCSQMGDCGSVTGGPVGGGGGSNPVKNVSFETCTSSDSAISTKGSRSVSWNKPCTVSILPCSNRFKQNVIEEVTSQSNQSQTNSNSASSSVASNIGCGNGGGGDGCPQHHHQHHHHHQCHATSQAIQTDLPSPPPSIISQDENTCMGELELEDPHNHHLLPPCCRESLRGEGNNNIGGGSSSTGGGSGRGGGRQSSSFCVTVTTFGVSASGAGGGNQSSGAGGGGGSGNPSNPPTTAKATDV